MNDSNSKEKFENIERVVVTDFETTSGKSLEPAVKEAVQYATAHPEERVYLTFNGIRVHVPDQDMDPKIFNAVENTLAIFAEEQREESYGKGSAVSQLLRQQEDNEYDRQRGK